MDINQLSLDAARSRSGKNEEKSAPSPAKPVVLVRDASSSSTEPFLFGGGEEPNSFGTLEIIDEETGEILTQRIEPALNNDLPDYVPPSPVPSIEPPTKVILAPKAEESSEKETTEKSDGKSGESKKLGFISRVLDSAIAKSKVMSIEKQKDKNKDKRSKEDDGEERDTEYPKKVESTKKSNFAPFIAAGMLVLLGIGIGIQQYRLSTREKEVAAKAEAARTKREKAVQDATNLLDPMGASSPTPVPPASSQPQATPAARADNALGTAPPSGVSQSQATSAIVATPSLATSANAGVGDKIGDNEDRYLQMLKAMKGGMAAQQANTAPSKLPPDIANAEVPRSGAGGKVIARHIAKAGDTRQDDQQLELIGNEIESTSRKIKPTSDDPLDHVSVLGSIKVDRTGSAPYFTKAIRNTEDGPAAFLYPRNADPLVFGKWYFVGDQTPEGWTVVKIERRFVNVVSPEGRVYRLES